MRSDLRIDHRTESWTFWGLVSVLLLTLGTAGQLLHCTIAVGWTGRGRSYFVMATMTKAVIFPSLRRLPWRTKPAIQHSREQSASKLMQCKRIFVGSSLLWLGFVTFNILVNDGFTRFEKRVSSCRFSKSWGLCAKFTLQKGWALNSKTFMVVISLCLEASSNYFLAFIPGYGCFPV